MSQFNTDLFKDSKPCMYFNLMSTQTPPQTRNSFEDVFCHQPCYDIARITINETPHWSILCLIARHIRAILNDLGMAYAITSPDMGPSDIDAAITDPACDPEKPYMVNRKIPVQIAVQGPKNVLDLLHLQLLNFLTRQMLGKTYHYVEKNHMYLGYIAVIRPSYF